ncbi:MAG: periplasmic heavy metal sensor [Maricaulaceae bacterium]|jgi:hypothetical protein
MTAAEVSHRSGRARAQRNFLMTALVAFLAGAVGAALGASVIVGGHEPETPGLHDLVHETLLLSPEQERALREIEESFALERREIEARLDAVNRDLAATIESHPSFDPAVGQAVERFHEVMGELQSATVQHVYDMRAILTDEQAEVFDERIARALVGDSR